MKQLLSILALLICHLGFCQSKNDKILLKKDEYGEVYITNDTSRREYKWLVPSDPDYNIEAYQNYYKQITSDTNLNFNFRNKHYNLSRWTSLYKIGNKYYLYGPSDWMSNFGFIINDSTILRQYSDGPDVFVILDSKRVSDKIYQYKTLSYNKKETKISIYIVDTLNEIAVWKLETGDLVLYELMINSNNIKKIPLVNCDCGDVKCFIEYDFKQPDFEKMIKNIH